MSTTTSRTSLAADRRKLTRVQEVAYWVSTTLASLAFAGIGAADLVRAAPIMEGLAHLGYPPYFATILGTWKVLAALTLLTPGLGLAKEWAYAGMFFTLTGAAISHAFNHDPTVGTMAPLVLLGVVMTSRHFAGGTSRLGVPLCKRPSGVTNCVEH